MQHIEINLYFLVKKIVLTWEKGGIILIVARFLIIRVANRVENAGLPVGRGFAHSGVWFPRI
jgi:hypothetical protein